MLRLRVHACWRLPARRRVGIDNQVEDLVSGAPQALAGAGRERAVGLLPGHPHAACLLVGDGDPLRPPAVNVMGLAQPGGDLRVSPGGGVRGVEQLVPGGAREPGGRHQLVVGDVLLGDPGHGTQCTALRQAQGAGCSGARGSGSGVLRERGAQGAGVARAIARKSCTVSCSPRWVGAMPAFSRVSDAWVELPNTSASAWRSIFRLCPKAASTSRKVARRSSSVPIGSSRSVNPTRMESTFGTGQNTCRLTIPEVFQCPYQAALTD